MIPDTVTTELRNKLNNMVGGKLFTLINNLETVFLSMSGILCLFSLGLGKRLFKIFYALF